MERELYLGIVAFALADKSLSKSFFFLTDGRNDDDDATRETTEDTTTMSP